jgi:putative tryptophan/tyrosine transport system substrate-binding protein
MMQRREFITLLGGAAAVWPLAARAQQSLPVIGYLYTGTPEAGAHLAVAFRQGLGEAGYVEGKNVVIEYRWAHANFDRLPELASDLVRRRVTVIATPVSGSAALAAKAVTAIIPIVFSTGVDPVEVGLVTSLNHPGANITGVSSMNNGLEAKRLGFLHELLPSAARFALLVNSKAARAIELLISDAQQAADAIGRKIEVLLAQTSDDIDAAFASIAQKKVEGLVVSSNSLFITRRVQLTTLAARHAVPAVYPFREDADAGGLMSYGSSNVDLARQTGVYTAASSTARKPPTCRSRGPPSSS